MLPWLVIYTVGRIGIAALLVLLLWLVGLGSFPGLLFGLLLSMPVSYVAAPSLARPAHGGVRRPQPRPPCREGGPPHPPERQRHGLT